MDKRIWEEAYRRAAANVPARVDRRMRDILQSIPNRPA